MDCCLYVLLCDDSMYVCYVLIDIACGFMDFGLGNFFLGGGGGWWCVDRQMSIEPLLCTLDVFVDIWVDKITYYRYASR